MLVKLRVEAETLRVYDNTGRTTDFIPWVDAFKKAARWLAEAQEPLDVTITNDRMEG